MASCTSLANQTIVFIRHGEKPDNDSGQLTCKGLNRALAIPGVLLAHYGKPDALFASAPDEAVTGSSLRPLTTITPLAIRLSMPINIQYHARDVKPLARALLKENRPLTLVSWEHVNLVRVAKTVVLKAGGDPSIVPDSWPEHDFDSIYVLTIDRDVTPYRITFRHQQEDLNGVADQCP